LLFGLERRDAPVFAPNILSMEIPAWEQAFGLFARVMGGRFVTWSGGVVGLGLGDSHGVVTRMAKLRKLVGQILDMFGDKMHDNALAL
tara:strand:+ start:440 stop:703 length:264 start_codon:yes stop_codon:yes gene_type:complete